MTLRISEIGSLIKSYIRTFNLSTFNRPTFIFFADAVASDAPIMPWPHAPIFSSKALFDVAELSEIIFKTSSEEIERNVHAHSVRFPRMMILPAIVKRRSSELI